MIYDKYTPKGLFPCDTVDLFKLKRIDTLGTNNVGNFTAQQIISKAIREVLNDILKKKSKNSFPYKIVLFVPGCYKYNPGLGCDKLEFCDTECCVYEYTIDWNYGVKITNVQQLGAGFSTCAGCPIGSCGWNTTCSIADLPEGDLFPNSSTAYCTDCSGDPSKVWKRLPWHFYTETYSYSGGDCEFKYYFDTLNCNGTRKLKIYKIEIDDVCSKVNR